jgi:hypothetical protein
MSDQTMSQRYTRFAVAGALLLHAGPAWTHQGALGAGAEPLAQAATGQARPAERCGTSWVGPLAGETGARGSALSLPNAYMAVNGRVFTLGSAVACAARLHTTRFN